LVVNSNFALQGSRKKRLSGDRLQLDETTDQAPGRTICLPASPRPLRFPCPPVMPHVLIERSSIQRNEFPSGWFGTRQPGALIWLPRKTSAT
jgi:hypothetical protein